PAARGTPPRGSSASSTRDRGRSAAGRTARTRRSLGRCSRVSSAYLAEVRAERYRPADRVGGFRIDEGIVVGASGAVGVVAGQAERWARLPPAELRAHHLG